MQRLILAIAGLFVTGTVVTVAALWPEERAGAARAPRRLAHAAAVYGAGLELAQRLARAAGDASMGTPDASVPGIETCLRVVDANGAAVAGAHVVVRRRDDGATLGATTTRDDGLAALGIPGVPLDMLVARATTDDGREGALDWLYETSCDRDLADLAALEVVAVSALRGVVVDERGEPVDDATLSLVDVASLADTARDGDVLLEPPDDALLREMVAADPGDVPALAHTAGDGTFVLPLHGAGSWALAARAAGTTTSYAGPVQLLPGRTATIRIVLHEGGTAMGTVVDGSGVGVRAATVTLSSGETTVTTSAGDDGAFRVPGLPRRAWSVTTSAYGYLPRAATPLALDAPTTLVLDHGASLALSVCLPRLQPSYVLAYAIGPETRMVGLGVGADARGCATGRIDTLPPGRYALWLAGSSLLASLGTVDVAATGETRVERTVFAERRARITAPAGMELTAASVIASVGGQSLSIANGVANDVLLAGSLHGARLSVDAWDADSRHSYEASRALDDGGGDLTLPLHVRAATNDDDAGDEDYVETCSISLQTVAFEGRAMVAYETTDVAPRLEPGDVIVAVDGERPAEGNTYDTRAWYGACDTRVTLRVERPGTGQVFDATVARTYVPDDD